MNIKIPKKASGLKCSLEHGYASALRHIFKFYPFDDVGCSAFGPHPIANERFQALKRVRPEFFVQTPEREYLYIIAEYVETDPNMSVGNCPCCDAGGFLFAGGAISYSSPQVTKTYFDGLVQHVEVTANFRNGDRTKFKNVAPHDKWEEFCKQWLADAGLLEE